MIGFGRKPPREREQQEGSRTRKRKKKMRKERCATARVSAQGHSSHPRAIPWEKKEKRKGKEYPLEHAMEAEALLSEKEKRKEEKEEEY